MSLPAAAPIAATPKPPLGAPAAAAAPVATRPGARDPRADDSAASNALVKQLAELFDATIVGITSLGTLTASSASDEAPASRPIDDDGPAAAMDEPD